MKIGDWIKFESAALSYINATYFIKVKQFNQDGVFGDFTFKGGNGKLLPLIKDGLFPWTDMNGMIVLKKSKRLDGLNAILEKSESLCEPNLKN